MRAQRVSELVGERIAWARHRQNWTQQRLADEIANHELAEDGKGSLNRAAVAKVESGVRKLSLDELFLVAAALNVSPLLLLVPVGTHDLMEVTPRSRVHPHIVLDWAMGEAPLAATNRLGIGTDTWRANAAPLTLWKHLRLVQSDVRQAEGQVRGAEYTGDEERQREARKQHVDSLTDLHEHLLRMQEAGLRIPEQHPYVLRDMRKVGLETEGLRRMSDEDFEEWQRLAEEGES